MVEFEVEEIMAASESSEYFSEDENLGEWD